MLAAYIVGGLLWAMLVFYFTWAALHDRPRKRASIDSDPYRISERMRCRARALEREGIFTTDHKGRERLGLK